MPAILSKLSILFIRFQFLSRDLNKTKILFYFNVKHTIRLKGYQNGNHIDPSEQRLQEISIAKNWPRAGFDVVAFLV